MSKFYSQAVTFENDANNYDARSIMARFLCFANYEVHATTRSCQKVTIVCQIPSCGPWPANQSDHVCMVFLAGDTNDDP